PFIVSEHSTGFAQQRLRRWERGLVWRVAMRADARIAVSPDLAHLLEAQFPGPIWEYVPNILGAEFLAPAPSRRSSGERGTGACIFRCAARMAPVKNQALLIEAFAGAFRGDAAVRLHLAGDGPTRPDLERLCIARDVAEQVAFLGALSPPEMRVAMDVAD